MVKSRLSTLISLLGLWSLIISTCHAQWAFGLKAPCPERVPFKLFAGTIMVRKDLKETKRKRNAFGTLHALGYKANRSGVYPQGSQMRPAKSLTTTDPEFRQGSDHLLSGIFRVYWRNGTLQSEQVFKDGYVLSYKGYYKNGNLMYWVDNDISVDRCLFTSYAQHCLNDEGPLPIREYIVTYIDKRLGWYSPSYASEASRHDWKMECELFAEPLLFVRYGSSQKRAMVPQRAVDSFMIVHPDRRRMPAYAKVLLPRKRCPDGSFDLSGLEMTLTHVSGEPVKWTGAELVLPQGKPFVGLRTRKPALDRYHYFPLGKQTETGFQAYYLTPGVYTMSIHYRANPDAEPVLIDQVPFSVLAN